MHRISRRRLSAGLVAAGLLPARSPFSGLAYGYGRFLSDSVWVLAGGYGGQIIAAHTAKRLAVTITSDPTLPARSEGCFSDLMALLDGPLLALA
jgi:hypothetical protein